MSDRPPNPPKLPNVPRWLIYVVILSVVASWIPLALIARSRAVKSPKERIHIFQDMDMQPKYLAQDPHGLYADGRAMRKPVQGTVARGQENLEADDHYYRGYETKANGQPKVVEQDGTRTYKWIDGFPERVDLNMDLLKRGRERYNIYCAVCHGHTGRGDGMVQQRAMQPDVPSPGWVPPVNLLQVGPNGNLTYGPGEYPEGKLLHTISKGKRTMPAYESQISTGDRWAIIAYVRALQRSQHFPAEKLPEKLKKKLE